VRCNAAIFWTNVKRSIAANEYAAFIDIYRDGIRTFHVSDSGFYLSAGSMGADKFGHHLAITVPGKFLRCAPQFRCLPFSSSTL
jgi:hypothetical protein